MFATATGTWPDIAALEGNRVIDRVFEPAMDAGTREEHLASWKRAVERALHWAQD